MSFCNPLLCDITVMCVLLFAANHDKFMHTTSAAFFKRSMVIRPGSLSIVDSHLASCILHASCDCVIGDRVHREFVSYDFDAHLAASLLDSLQLFTLSGKTHGTDVCRYLAQEQD